MPCFWANYIYVNVNVHATIINQIITYFTILPIFLCFQINQEMRKNIRPIICKKNHPTRVELLNRNVNKKKIYKVLF